MREVIRYIKQGGRDKEGKWTDGQTDGTKEGRTEKRT